MPWKENRKKAWTHKRDSYNVRRMCTRTEQAQLTETAAV